MILVTLGLGAAVMLLTSLWFGISSLISLFSNGGDPAGTMIGAVAYGFEVVLVLLCAWVVLQKTMGQERADLPFNLHFANWQVMAGLILVILSAVIGWAAASTGMTWLNWFVLPVLTLLVIVPPVWMLFGIGTRGIELGPRWRVLGVLGLGMTLGPTIMIIMETVLLIGAIVAGLIVTAIKSPVLFQEVISLGQRIQLETDQELILKLLAPYVANPLVIASIIAYIAVFVPLIEELFKPLAVWLFAKKLDSPAQGFAMGMLSGGAFAMLESLNASGNGGTSWPLIVSIRAATTLLHMTVSGIVGWGIVSAFHEKKVLRFFAAYFAAASIHGIWNACAVGAGISTLGEFLGSPEWLFNIIPAAVCGMSVLGIGMLAVLIASNRKIRNAAHSAQFADKNAEEIQPIL